MPSCVFRRCKNYGAKVKKDEGITYHRLPSDEILKYKWVKIIRAERNEYNWIPTQGSSVCSAHFIEGNKYTTSKGYVRIKKSAVPVIQTDDVPRSATPNSLCQENISDVESIFDSPIEAALKKRVEGLLLDKKNLQKKNKVLKEHNKRLRAKVINLKAIFKSLKYRKIVFI